MTTRCAANPDSWVMSRFRARTSPVASPSNWPVRYLCMASSPWIVPYAVANAPNPNPGFTRRFTHRCFCSIGLLATLGLLQ